MAAGLGEGLGGRGEGGQQRTLGNVPLRDEHLERWVPAVGHEPGPVTEWSRHPVDTVDGQAVVGGRPGRRDAAARDDRRVAPRVDRGIGRVGGDARAAGDRARPHGGGLGAYRIGTLGGHGDRDAAGAAPEPRDPGEEEYRRPQTCTTVQVRVRVMPGTSWILAMTSLPSSSTVLASTRAMTS